MFNFLGIRRNKLTAVMDSITNFTCSKKAMHEGCLYTVADIITVPLNTRVFICGKTPITKNVIMSLPVISGNQPDLEIFAYKNTVYNEMAGTASTIQNHNHQVVNPSQWQDLRQGLLIADITDIGEKFFPDYIPGSTGLGGTTQGGTNMMRESYKFAKNTNYCMELKNNSSNNNKLLFSIEWYETPDNIY